MRGWPLPRPTHAPATTLKTNGNSAPIKPMSFPSSVRVKQSPNPLTPRAAAPAAACVSDHSCGQHMPPQRLPIQPQKNPPPIVIPESPPPGGASHRSCGCAVAKRLHGRGGAGEIPGEFFHTLTLSAWERVPRSSASHSRSSQTPRPLTLAQKKRAPEKRPLFLQPAGKALKLAANLQAKISVQRIARPQSGIHRRANRPARLRHLRRQIQAVLDAPFPRIR